MRCTLVSREEGTTTSTGLTEAALLHHSGILANPMALVVVGSFITAPQFLENGTTMDHVLTVAVIFAKCLP